ncbi:hypothetical protein QL285_039328 [Trifolium repens]|nr:hypothetical protein QL285_039328 [Trifolium repens]
MFCVSSLRRRAARHGEIIGPEPIPLARRAEARQGEVHQHEKPSCSGLENHFHFISMKSPLTFIYPVGGKENITKTFGFGSGVGYARGRC